MKVCTKGATITPRVSTSASSTIMLPRRSYLLCRHLPTSWMRLLAQMAPRSAFAQHMPHTIQLDESPAHGKQMQYWAAQF